MALKVNNNDNKTVKKNASSKGSAMMFKDIVVMVLTAASAGFKQMENVVVDILMKVDGTIARTAGVMQNNPVKDVEAFLITLANNLVNNLHNFDVNLGNWFNKFSGTITTLDDAITVLGATYAGEAWADEPQQTPLYKAIKAMSNEQKTAKKAVSTTSAPAPADLATLIATAVAEALKNQ